MTPAIQKFVGEQAALYPRIGEPRKLNVLEIGSFDVNGGLRHIFDGDNYLGIDMRAGPGVDLVCNAHDLPAYFNYAHNHLYDVILCCEVLEHDDNPFLTIDVIQQLAKSGAMVIITVPGIGFPKHDYPSDYWRFTPEAVKLLFNRMGCTRVGIMENSDHTVLARGFMP